MVDSIVAEDIGKLPDKAIGEMLQRLADMSVDRTMSSISSLNVIVGGR